jgi:hypothetical protein
VPVKLFESEHFYMTTVYQTSLPEHLAVTTAWFADNPNLKRGVLEDSHLTTLNQYSRTEIKINQDFANRADAQPFVQSIQQSAKQFLNGPGRPFITGLWLNEMRTGEHHYPHHHLGCYYAGCYYVEIPKGASGITFYDPINQIIDPIVGDLLLWRGIHFHKVPKSNFLGTRRSIAFNIVIAPELEV